MTAEPPGRLAAQSAGLAAPPGSTRGPGARSSVPTPPALGTAAGRLRRAAARGGGALAAAVLSCGLTAAIFTAGTYRLTVGSRGFGDTGDDHVYLYMTRHPVGSFHIAPWCWRLGVPALVRYLPVSPQAGYEAVALTSVAVTGLLVYLIARKWGFARWLSLTGVIVFFSFGYAAKFNLKDFWLTDAPAFAFASAAILALQYRRRYLFAACLLAGVFAKESVIFVAPLAYTFWARGRWDGRAFARMCLAALPAVAALLALRAVIPAWNGDHAYVATLPHAVRADIGNLPTYNMLTVAGQTLAIQAHTWLRTLRYVLFCFGLLAIGMTVPGLRSLRPVLARFWPLLVLDLAQLAFAFNTRRLVVFAFVPVIIGCLTGAEQAMRRFGTAGAWFPLAAAVAVALEFIQSSLSSPTLTLQEATLGPLCLLAVAVTVRGRLRARRPDVPARGPDVPARGPDVPARGNVPARGEEARQQG